MSYDVLSWIFILMILVGVVGLVGTIMADISRALSRGTANVLRVLLVLCGVLGALGIGSLVFGVFPGGPSPHSSVTGVNATGHDGILTQGQKTGQAPANP
ncbi:hypothetical protein [Acidisoma sp. 7E03]